LKWTILLYSFQFYFHHPFSSTSKSTYVRNNHINNHKLWISLPPTRFLLLYSLV
jgi:hypothetical protein